MHGMTLVSFGLFGKNLGNLREFFGQMVHRPPWQKNCPYAYVLLHRATEMLCIVAHPSQVYKTQDIVSEGLFILSSPFEGRVPLQSNVANVNAGLRGTLGSMKHLE